MNCYCDEPDHEMCWDGLITQADPKCGCCQETTKEMKGELIRTIRHGSSKIIWADEQPEQDTPTTPSVPKIPSDGERIAGAKEVLLDPDIGNYDTGWAVFAACNDCIHEALSGSNSRMSGVLTETGDVVIQVDSDDCTYH